MTLEGYPRRDVMRAFDAAALHLGRSVRKRSNPTSMLWHASISRFLVEAGNQSPYGLGAWGASLGRRRPMVERHVTLMSRSIALADIRKNAGSPEGGGL
ncbi:hypothetical protein ACRE_015280 [Hapsidospora chrysogenum ATCC 11550]|uniref:Uncharacterized protein n=1 Tax=Hapsidospora chrysogenum (strain ATCC 11550 / CBS 779.69 / DSM 880 / IAM 14645 / JCM 23072 / IMI 49137) TaxID=857340 RepID=A0A086TE27_HAPC1|nr:hypothetical protein ACRE_015280 [Hapsidospora chrysogenum ATCC 11550]